MQRGAWITNLEDRAKLPEERISGHDSEIAGIIAECGPIVFGPPQATPKRTAADIGARGIIGVYRRA